MVPSGRVQITFLSNGRRSNSVIGFGQIGSVAILAGANRFYQMAAAFDGRLSRGWCL